MESTANDNEDVQFIFVPCLAWVKREVVKFTTDKKTASLIRGDKEKQFLDKTKLKLESYLSNLKLQPSYKKKDYRLELEDSDKESKKTNTSSVGDYDSDEFIKKDKVLRPSDNLIVVGKINHEMGNGVLEVYVYNDKDSSLYCHHNVVLPSYPLCIECIHIKNVHLPGVYCAMGTLSPIIDVWNLETNSLEPAFCLGSKGSWAEKIVGVGHKDAVLDLSWNHYYHHVLASSSADCSVLIWDIETKKPNHKIAGFEKDIRSIVWNQEDGSSLLAGSSDKTVKIFDCSSVEKCLNWQLDAGVKKVSWFPNNSNKFLAGTNSGMLYCIDSRKGVLWKHQAHNSIITDLNFYEKCPGLLVTSSNDKLLKIWDVNGEIKLVFEKDLKMLALHCIELCPDIPFLAALGGSVKTNNFTVLNLQSIDSVRQYFSSRINTE